MGNACDKRFYIEARFIKWFNSNLSCNNIHFKL
jgi:hypothetical protein